MQSDLVRIQKIQKEMDIKLTDWQWEIVKKIYNSPLRVGKSYLINFLYEYEKGKECQNQPKI